MRSSLFLLLLFFIAASCQNTPEDKKTAPDESHSFTSTAYADLEALFVAWRAFEKPPLYEGAPDYRASTFEKRTPAFIDLQKRLKSIDTAGWPVSQQVDWMIVWAEMNGYHFNQRVLKPWERDPAFYKTIWSYRSDVPAHEGPTHHAVTELWTYDFPLSKNEEQRLVADLQVISPLYDQARQNLTGNARDLWITGIRDIKAQSKVLQELKKREGVHNNPSLLSQIDSAIASTDAFAAWLEQQATSKDGPSGIGKENYTWYLQNVHLVPLSWEDEVIILRRELARAWAALKMEEHKNRELPPLQAADSPQAYNRMADKAAKSLLSFLEYQDIVTVKPYFEPALRAHLGAYVPENKRNFFVIGEHFDPRPLYSHFYHWFELARMDTEPHSSLMRKGPLLYNIFDSRNEGTATAVEEMFLQAGLYEDSPRSREIVYIMIAQRAARGLGSLYAHANEMTMEEAGGIHSEYTPRGWMKTEKELLIFEQHLYLRQPGYGTSYITGKYLLEAALADFGLQQETSNTPFVAKEFFDKLNAMGNIPISLGHWQMTGRKAHLDVILKADE